MRKLKISAAVLGGCSLAFTLLTYYWNHTWQLRALCRSADRHVLGTPISHAIKTHFPAHYEPFGAEGYFLNTTGCKIPLSIMNYKRQNMAKYASCGSRLVFIKKNGDDRVKFYMLKYNLRKYFGNQKYSHCCYRFIQRSSVVGQEDKKIQFTHCKKIEHGAVIQLDSDYINVRCLGLSRFNHSIILYDDVYGFAKKVKARNDIEKMDIKYKFNVLLVGMDGMSLPRVAFTMPRTHKYFRANSWLNFRGYHKVGDNTFPNVMAALTGKSISIVNKACNAGMDNCSNLLIWNEFHKAGYTTAYGEDYLRLPDTFSPHKGFRHPPTDHYMRPLFLKGETELANRSLVCSGRATSGQQILDYASDFVETYKNDSFFGFFWINSYSHNVNSSPRSADRALGDFLYKLMHSGITGNTFVMFLSDHGIRFGEGRTSVESFYDERLPALFVWVPTLFRSTFPVHYRNMMENQLRLVTPYDLYETLRDISTGAYEYKSNESYDEISQSLFSLVPDNRTCVSTGIDEKWCTCHKLYHLDSADSEGLKSVNYVIAHVKNSSRKVETKPCWKCMQFTLQNVIRVHFYYDVKNVDVYHVVALTLTPGNISYEATVLKSTPRQMVGPVSVISSYRGLGNCAVRRRDRLFCACQRIDNCPK